MSNQESRASPNHNIWTTVQAHRKDVLHLVAFIRCEVDQDPDVDPCV